MKNKNGFTLIELLAIIMLLGLIGLIVTPKINATLVKQEKNSFKEGVNGIVKAVKQDAVNNVDFNSSKSNYRAYTYDETGLYLTVEGTQATDSKINISGNIEKGVGTVVVTNNSDIIFAIHNDKFCAKKNTNNSNITIEEYTGVCVNDEIDIPEATSCFTYESNPDSTLTITGYNYSDSACSKDLVIPNRINGKTVSKIADFAFVDAEVIIAEYIEEDINGNIYWYDEFLENIPENKEIVWMTTTTSANVTGKYCYTDIDGENEVDVDLNYIHTEGDGYYSCYYHYVSWGNNGINNYNIKSIDFSQATALTEIPFALAMFSTITSINIGDYINNISDFAFMNNFITILYIPSKIVSIENFAFYENNITNLDLSSATSLKYIKEGSFANNLLTNLTIKNLNNLQIIHGGSYGAFEDNLLTSVNLENLSNLTNIGLIEDTYGAFNYNNISSLTLSNLPKLTTIGAWAFYYNKINNLTLVNSLTTIGKGAFAANNLSTVIIPANVTTLASLSFSKCSCGEGSDNVNLNKIENKTGRSFDWSKIIGLGTSATCSFVTGKCSTVTITG